MGGHVDYGCCASTQALTADGFSGRGVLTNCWLRNKHKVANRGTTRCVFDWRAAEAVDVAEILSLGMDARHGAD